MSNHELEKGWYIVRLNDDITTISYFDQIWSTISTGDVKKILDGPFEPEDIVLKNKFSDIGKNAFLKAIFGAISKKCVSEAIKELKENQDIVKPYCNSLKKLKLENAELRRIVSEYHGKCSCNQSRHHPPYCATCDDAMKYLDGDEINDEEKENDKSSKA